MSSTSERALRGQADAPGVLTEHPEVVEKSGVRPADLVFDPTIAC
jgi:hypothetical protein